MEGSEEGKGVKRVRGLRRRWCQGFACELFNTTIRVSRGSLDRRPREEAEAQPRRKYSGVEERCQLYGIWEGICAVGAAIPATPLRKPLNLI